MNRARLPKILLFERFVRLLLVRTPNPVAPEYQIGLRRNGGPAPHPNCAGGICLAGRRDGNSLSRATTNIRCGLRAERPLCPPLQPDHRSRIDSRVHRSLSIAVRRNGNMLQTFSRNAASSGWRFEGHDLVARATEPRIGASFKSPDVAPAWVVGILILGPAVPGERFLSVAPLRFRLHRHHARKMGAWFPRPAAFPTVLFFRVPNRSLRAAQFEEKASKGEERRGGPLCISGKDWGRAPAVWRTVAVGPRLDF